MEKRYHIPDTSLDLSWILLGTGKAGLTYQGAETDRLLLEYLDMGGNVIDTARVYSDWVPGETGRSENELGRSLKRIGRRNDFILMTKGGHPDMHAVPRDMHHSRNTREEMRGDLEKSLKALGTETIDIYFYHRDQTSLPVAEEIETMETFRKEGKIRYYGCSNWSAERMKEADAYAATHGLRGFVADEAMLSMGVKYKNVSPDTTLRSIEGDIYDYHRNNLRCAAMAFSSVAEGYFHRLAADPESVKGSAYDTPGNHKVAERVNELMAQYHATRTQVLLGYCFFQDFPCLALFGPRNAGQISDVMGTLDIPFRREDYEI